MRAAALLLLSAALALAQPPPPNSCTMALRQSIQWGAGTNSLGVRFACVAEPRHSVSPALCRRSSASPPPPLPSAQIEGSLRAGNRTPSVWEVRPPQGQGAIADGATPDVAIDFYKRYKADIALMRQLGLRHLRLSLSWSRLLPGGRAGSPISREGVAFYSSLLDELRTAGVRGAVEEGRAGHARGATAACSAPQHATRSMHAKITASCTAFFTRHLKFHIKPAHPPHLPHHRKCKPALQRY